MKPLGDVPGRGVAPVLAGAVVLSSGVVARLAVTDGLAETVRVVVGALGAVLLAASVAVLVRGRPARRD